MVASFKKHSNGFTSINRVKLIHGGQEYFDVLQHMIHQAGKFIHLQMYILANDATGNEVMNALMAAAARGVEVYVVADGYASQQIRNGCIRKLHEAGVHFKFFEPLLKSRHFYFGRRMHRKVVVADGICSLLGGMNIADKYNQIATTPPWLDIALYIEGEASMEVLRICEENWEELHYTFSRQDLGAFLTTIPKAAYCSVRIGQNDWIKGKQEIWHSYFQLFNCARESITIVCSYFLPGRILRKQLSQAAKRGVVIRVMLAGPSDVLLAKYAERYLYNWMFENGIQVYEYQPTVLHAKTAVVDEHWVTIGSFNINNISTYASIELNADVRNKAFAHSFHTELTQLVVKDCIKITPNYFKRRFPYWQRFLDRIAFNLVQLILILTTFYFKREE